MKKILNYLLIEIVVIFFFVFLLSPIFIREEFGINREGGQATFNLSSGQTFTQIISQHPSNLDSISLQLKNPQIKNNSELTVDIDDLNNSLLQEFTFYGANVGDPSWIKLKFKPLNSPGYQIKVYVDPNPNDLYLYIDKNNQMDLHTTSYLPGFKNRFLGNINYQVKQFKQRNYWHNIGYFFILSAFNLYLFYLLYKKPSQI
jgi:hypothetical protein